MGKQAEAKKQEHQSLVDVELEKSIQKLKEESAKYEAKMKLKKVVAAQDEKVIEAAEKAAKAHQKQKRIRRSRCMNTRTGMMRRLSRMMRNGLWIWYWKNKKCKKKHGRRRWSRKRNYSNSTKDKTNWNDELWNC